MRKLFGGVILIGFCLIMLLGMSVVIAQESEELTDEEQALLDRGDYLVHIAGCFACHSPHQEEYSDPTEFSLEQLQAFAWFPVETLDLENQFMAGGRPFALGPLGVLNSANLTPHEETGIGSWTDEQLEVAFRFGVNPSGRILFPLMPYLNYFNLAERDADAIIAYLRTIDPVEHEVDRSGPSGEGLVPILERTEPLPELPPDGSDPVELGAYLVNVVMSCNDCHQPRDPATGALLPELGLSGGDPFFGPGEDPAEESFVVYGGNITPHEETGIADWADDDIRRVFRQGLRPDGRRLIVMPWEDYSSITDDDLDAVIAYLRSLEPVDNEVPAAAINEALVEFVDLDE